MNRVQGLPPGLTGEGVALCSQGLATVLIEQQVQSGQGLGPALRSHVIAHVLHQGRRCLGVVDLEGELCTFRLVFILLLAQGSRGQNQCAQEPDPAALQACSGRWVGVGGRGHGVAPDRWGGGSPRRSAEVSLDQFVALSQDPFHTENT